MPFRALIDACWKEKYTAARFTRDLIAGITVGIIAIPLAMALAIGSGVAPQYGLYTAAVAGIVIALTGGSRFSVSGPTAAFVVILYPVSQQFGLAGLLVAALLSGIFLILMGLARFGRLIEYIPVSVTLGFTSGIGITIGTMQIKDFLGLTYPAGTATVETMDKLKAIIANIGTFNIKALIVGAVSLAILIIWPKFKSLDKIPPSLIAVIVSVLMVKFIGPLKDVNTIGSLYTIKKGLPGVSVPSVNMDMILTLLPDALTIAVLAGIESLLSCVVSDGMIGSRHKPNMELVAQGAGNIVSALFGGIPATGAIARTAANVKNGGRTPIAGMVHSVTLLIVLVVLMPYAAWIPMPAIAAILFIVAYNMSGWREMVNLVKHSPKSDTLVLLTTMVLTVVFDLVVAIEVGIVMAALLFLKRMADVTEVRSWKYIGENIDENNDPESINLKKVPDKTLVYEIIGPMFFAAADKFMDIHMESDVKVVIIRMRGVPAMDISALRSLKNIHNVCKKRGITMVLSHVQEQPKSMMEKAGFAAEVGEDNFCANIDAALAYAQEIVG